MKLEFATKMQRFGCRCLALCPMIKYMNRVGGVHMLKQERFDLGLNDRKRDNFFKSISAFSNYGDGKILFEIKDTSVFSDINRKEKELQKVESMINASIKPTPIFKVDVEEIGGKTYLVINILKGRSQPYLYKNKAYKKLGNLYVQVDKRELKELICWGLDIYYEDMEAKKTDLKFTYLDQYLKGRGGRATLTGSTLDVFRVKGKKDYYNFAGELFADENDLEFAGIEIIKYGGDKEEVIERETLSGKSILWQYHRVLEVFESLYRHKDFRKRPYRKSLMIPEEAFTNALAGAIFNRQWDIKANMQICMYKDKIEIILPGKIPYGLSEKDYVKVWFSGYRNCVIFWIFIMLYIVDKSLYGFLRVKRAYKDSITKPYYEFSDDCIKTVLPVVDEDFSTLSPAEAAIYKLLGEKRVLTRLEIDSILGFNKYKTLRLLNSLLDKRLVEKCGNGPSTRYALY